MKNLFSLVIVSSLFFSGCGKSDFEFKKECANYNSVEQERMREEWPSKPTVVFNGIFYSRTLETCVSEWFIYDLWDSGLDEMYVFYDVLTENRLERFNTGDIGLDPPLQSNNNERVEAYRKELDLIK